MKKFKESEFYKKYKNLYPANAIIKSFQEKEFKDKSYDEMINYNIDTLTDFINMYDNLDSDSIFIMIRAMYKDPDGVAIKYQNSIACTCDGLLSIKRLFDNDGATDKLISDYQKYRKYPIIYFPRDFNGINQLRASTFGDKIDHTLFDIKNYYQNKECKLGLAYSLNNTKKWLDSFNSFEELINWEFDNNEDIIKIFVDMSDIHDYKVYDIEKSDGTIIGGYLESYNYNWSDEYYNNVKKMIDKYNETKERIKVIHFDKIVDERVKSKMPYIQFITIDTSLDVKKLKTKDNKLLKEVIKNNDIVFVVCDETKDNIILETLKVLKGLPTLTIGIGLKDNLLSNLNKYVDAVVSNPSDNLKDITNINNVNLDNALYYTIKSITDLIFTKGIINIDLDDIKNILKNGRNSLVTIGIASSDNRAIDSTLQACNNLTNKDFSDIIINIVSDDSLTNFEIEDVVETIKRSVNNKNTNILFQVILDNVKCKNKEIMVTLIALY